MGSITGVTINDYQVRRAKKLTKQRESGEAATRMKYIQGDFTKLVPSAFQPESLDAVYYIESACHISNRKEIFSESAKALKKGGRLFSYEWVMTDRYDASNPEHVAIKKGIEYGNGIENMISIKEVVAAVEASGSRSSNTGTWWILQNSGMENTTCHGITTWRKLTLLVRYAVFSCPNLASTACRSCSGWCKRSA